MKAGSLMVLVSVVFVLSLSAPLLVAKDFEFPQVSDKPIFQILQNILNDKDSDKRVTLKLKSGHELEGKIKNLNSSAVRIEKLAGMEFYDAVVAVDHISAVILKVRP